MDRSPTPPDPGRRLQRRPLDPAPPPRARVRGRRRRLADDASRPPRRGRARALPHRRRREPPLEGRARARVLKIAWVPLRKRPDVVVSTGAAPGYLAIRGARLLGARTAWIDRVANVDELSLSGRLASARADLCLTQWPRLAGGRVRHHGAVL